MFFEAEEPFLPMKAYTQTQYLADKGQLLWGGRSVVSERWSGESTLQTTLPLMQGSGSSCL